MKMTISVSGKEPQGAAGRASRRDRAPAGPGVADSVSLPCRPVRVCFEPPAPVALAIGSPGPADARSGFDRRRRRLRRCRFVGIGAQGAGAPRLTGNRRRS